MGLMDINYYFANNNINNYLTGWLDSRYTYTATNSAYSNNISLFTTNPFQYQLSTPNLAFQDWSLPEFKPTNIFNKEFNIFSSPDFSINTPSLNIDNSLEFNTPINIDYNFSISSSSSGSKSSSRSQKKKNNNSTSTDYADLTREEAIAKASKDPNLKELKTSTSKNGNKVIISDESFINDIPYARIDAMEKLLAAADEIGRDITVTSALGTANSPHCGASQNTGHYDPLNPKLDFGGGLSKAEAEALKRDLAATGYFASINVESDGATSHLDVKLA